MEPKEQEKALLERMRADALSRLSRQLHVVTTLRADLTVATDYMDALKEELHTIERIQQY